MENMKIYLNTSWMVLIISNKESKRKFTKFQRKYRDRMTGISHFSGFMIIKNQGSFCILSSAILSMMTLSQPSLLYSIIRRWLPQFKMPHKDDQVQRKKRATSASVSFCEQDLSKKTPSICLLHLTGKGWILPSHWPLSKPFTISLDQWSIMCGLWTTGCPLELSLEWGAWPGTVKGKYFVFSRVLFYVALTECIKFLSLLSS